MELLPPGATPPPAPGPAATSRSMPCRVAPATPISCPASACSAAAERVDRRPFSAADVSRTVADVAVEFLKTRGEPASSDRLLGDVLVGLDRAGQLRRLVADRGLAVERAENARGSPRTTIASRQATATSAGEGARQSAGTTGASSRSVGSPWAHSARSGGLDAPADPVEALLELIRTGLSTTARDRLTELAPGRWWLGDRRRSRGGRGAARRSGRMGGVQPAVDRRAAVRDRVPQRIAWIFSGHDLPDEALVRACLQSYRSRASTSDRHRDRRRSPRAGAGAHASSSRISPTSATASGCVSGSAAASRRAGSGRAGSATSSTSASVACRSSTSAGPARRSPRSTAPGTAAAGCRCCSRSSGRRCSASRSSAATPGSPRTRARFGSS